MEDVKYPGTNDVKVADRPRYWVLFLQPLPESGERIAIALAFQTTVGRAYLRYDHNFAKPLRLYPDFDPQTLRMYFESLEQDLRGEGDPEVILRSYGPQIAVSPPRRMANPVPEDVIEMLVKRYIYVARERPLRLSAGAAAKAQERYLANPPQSAMSSTSLADALV